MRLYTIVKVLAFAVITGCVLSADCECCDDYEKVELSETLTKNHTQYVLQAPGANKNCHAKFRLEVAWKDASRAGDPAEKSPFSDSTDLWYNFRASEGSFVLIPVPPRKDSILVTGGWFYLFYWTMDIGAKNETSNPTTYEIRVWCNGLANLTSPPDHPYWWDVAVAGRIEYVPFDPGL